MRHPLLLAFLLTLIAGSARADGYAWDDSTCAVGGSWVDSECWTGPGAYPDGVDDFAFLQLDTEGAVNIPTASFLNITLNSLQLTENVALSVSDNMFLVLSRSTSGSNPSLQVDNVLTLSSPDLGTSGLRASTPSDPEATSELLIYGAGEIRLGSNGSLESAPRARILLTGGVEIVSSASAGKPSRINAELRNVGGEIRVLGGTLELSGEVENVGGAFVEVFDQYATGLSELRVKGILRGGKVYPGLGVIRLDSGEMADVDIQPGPVEVSNSLGFFSGHVQLSGGTEVTVPPTRTLQIGSTAESGAPSLHNDGIIRVGDAQAGGGTLRSDGSVVDLEGNGNVILAHPGSSLAGLGGGVFRNGPNHTLEGAGFIQCLVQNEGQFVVDGGTMVLFSSVTGPTGDTTILGDATTPALLNVSAGFVTQNLRVSEFGELLVNNGRSVVVHGAWTVETQDETAIQWNVGTQLIFAGTGPSQGFETTSEDLGAVNAGFSGNFAIPRVAIVSGSTVFLRDLRDNGNRTPASEAVYATALDLPAGATLNLNGYCFYTKLNGVPYRVQAGDGALFGGGTIVDDPSGVVAVQDPTPRIPGEIQVSPNPFNPQTTIRFQVERAGTGGVTIHDLRGRRLRTLARDTWVTGSHELVWDGRDDAGRGLASGVYVVRLAIGSDLRTRPVTLLK